MVGPSLITTKQILVDETLPQNLDSRQSALARSKEAELTITTSEGQARTTPPEGLPFDFHEQIGQGAFGTVWKATDRAGQEVAVKVMRRADQMDWNSFETELRRLRSVAEHPHVVTLLDADLQSDSPYLSTLFYGSGSLAEIGQSETEEVLGWLKQIAEALKFTHDRGLLHCDLKPANILLDKEKRVRVADFGQSRLRESSGGSWGTLGFMAPEQASEEACLPIVAWDIYSFGATAYRLLTDRTPYMDDSVLKALTERTSLSERLSIYRKAIAPGKLVPIRDLNPKVDKPLADIIEACLRPYPDDRPDSFAEILNEFERRERYQPLVCRRPWTTPYKVDLAFKRLLKIYADQFATVATVLALTLVMLGALTMKAEHSDMLQDRRILAEYAAQIVSDTMSTNLWFEMHFDAGEELQPASKLEFVQKMEVLDKNGTSVGVWQRPEPRPSELFLVEQPIHFHTDAGPEFVGTVIVESSAEGFWEHNGRSIALLFGTIWLLAVMVPWIVARVVLR